MLRFDHVSKAYGEKMAVEDLDIEIRDGEIFGLIGHNGAGKSTTIKMLVSILAPSFGTIYLDGQPLSEDPIAQKKKIGYVPDSPNLFLRLPAADYWHLIGQLYEVPADVLAERQAYLVDVFELQGQEREVIENFSHGMRQKVFLIGALLPEPDLWVLDEPMTGLDPQASFNLKEMMRAHAAAGHTVLFSTHMLATAQEVCDRIGILRHGRLVFAGTMEELIAAYPGQNLEDIYLRLIKSAESGSPMAEMEANSGDIS